MKAETVQHVAETPDLSKIASTVELLRRQIAQVAPGHAERVYSEPHLRAVHQILRKRRSRLEVIGADLLGEPAWDMLLELYALEIEQRRISVSKLCLASGVPPTTALRWVDKLQESGLVTRKEDPFDARRTWVGLSDDGNRRMREYFDAVAK